MLYLLGRDQTVVKLLVQPWVLLEDGPTRLCWQGVGESSVDGMCCLWCFLQICPNVLRIVLVAGPTVPSNMLVRAVNSKRPTLVTCVPLDQG